MEHVSSLDITEFQINENFYSTQPRMVMRLALAAGKTSMRIVMAGY